MKPQAITGYCKIENSGEVDENAFRLLGASTKEDDSTKIGFFGSGIKYAVASALREGIPLRCFSGTKEIKISTKKTTMSGMDFEVICINGKETSLTTRMGKTWKPWFIFREFYCNALDEADASFELSAEPVGEKGKTRIFIGITPAVKDVLGQFDQYFSSRRTPLITIGLAKLFLRAGEKMVVFRKGIRVFSEHKSIYDYDLDDLGINESRESSDFDVNFRVATLWKTQGNPEMIKALLAATDEYELVGMNWSTGLDYNMSAHWHAELKHKIVVPREHGGHFVDEISQNASRYAILPHALCEILHRRFPDLTIRGFRKEDEELATLPPTPRQEQFITEAKSFLLRAGIEFVAEFPIHVAELERRQLGRAEKGQVYLSPEVFKLGKREVVKTLLEEVVHCKTDADDKSLLMQDTLFNMLVGSYEDRLGEYL